MKIAVTARIAFDLNEEMPLDGLPIRAEVGAESLHIQELTGEGRVIQIDALLLSTGKLGVMFGARLETLLREVQLGVMFGARLESLLKEVRA